MRWFKLKFLWWAVLGIFGVLSYFDVPLPRDWASTMTWMTSIEIAAQRYVAHPVMFALFIGLLTGTVILPEVWQVVRRRLEAPKLKCSFAMDMPGCVVRNVPTHHLGPPGASGPKHKSWKDLDWFRIKVETLGNISAHKCRGRVISLKRNSSELLEGETPVLGFSPADEPDTLSKTIHSSVPEFLDFLTADKTDGVAHIFRGHLVGNTNWGKLFSDAGIYYFRVVVTSDDVGTSHIDLHFDWTLDPDTSKITVVK